MAIIRVNMVAIVKPRINAFTLFESVVAISIIAILIGIGSLIYGNIIKSEKPFAYFQAHEQIKIHFENLNTTKAFFNHVFDHESYTIQQSITFYKGNEKLYQITYSAFIGSKAIITQKYLLVNE